ncbi:MAG: hypothetical protein U0168_00170 [Nannocystaceae bacterium]|jgi:ABC-type branched-subunit amino acid transport system permease subunit
MIVDADRAAGPAVTRPATRTRRDSIIDLANAGIETPRAVVRMTNHEPSLWVSAVGAVAVAAVLAAIVGWLLLADRGTQPWQDEPAPTSRAQR